MKKMLFLLLLVLLVAWFREDVWQGVQKIRQPENRVVNQATVLAQIRSLNHLDSTAFHMETIVKTEKQGNWFALWQDSQKGIFTAKGSVHVGLDLNKLTEKNVQIAGDTVIITLPPVEILSVQVERVDVYDLRTGILNLRPADLSVLEQVRQVARVQMLQQACTNGVLAHAKEQTRAQVERLFALAQVKVSVYTPAALPKCVYSAK
ncbi:DUF4230 domain-containing protein [Wielerella bovis]|uniref:DUF4230 domain-containing protein n=1 Tax=Wielerella bovis TaxID=2917790 RepID=UPI002018BC1D|nr:DUF4230 domain-containing protein [Wielerella bovis]MCG7656533.1 DUF4230 domain-containing protein [Wielerella bovis]MCG7658758.1 DUF4230 domain-containing protein [Wielerella bovis]